MANILSLGRRIQTAQNVSKTTRAMQMIATSKLKRAQDAALTSRVYVEKLTSITKNITSKLNENEMSIYMKENNSGKPLIIIVSPDKGLCGGLITNLMKKLLDEGSVSKNVVYINIGKKLETQVVRLNREVIASFEFGTTLPSFDIVYPIIKIIDEEFIGGKVSEVKILYSKFLTVFTQTPQIDKILPIKVAEAASEDDASSSFSLFEPKASEMLPSILKHYIEMVVYQLILESYASEQAARMVAMKNATENAHDMIDDLKLEYNKQRQEKITNEILDIGSGASFLMYE